MSNLAKKTERKALKVLANTLRFFEGTAKLDMTATDAFKAREAENILKGIIEANGFTANYEKGKGTTLTKQKNRYYENELF
ncbi:MAG: hypothetical protein JWR50_3009 [Mucilaginibacter sp.]|nr:hypothetical protein [Mucilaginibacter sp.]